MKFLKALFYSCFFLSGICGLIYEVLWSRYLGMFIGNSTYAHAMVLATFMGGLALGNFIIGRRADQTNQCLTLYAKLELCIGLYAVATPILFQISRFFFLPPSGLPLHWWFYLSES